MKILRSKLKQIIEEEIDIFFNEVLSEARFTREDLGKVIRSIILNTLESGDLEPESVTPASQEAVKKAIEDFEKEKETKRGETEEAETEEGDVAPELEDLGTPKEKEVGGFSPFGARS